jgi:hypothetical protein
LSLPRHQGTTFCWLPGVVICGICPDPVRECETDEDCAPDLCIEVPPYCPGCPGGNSSHCIPRCTTDSCGSGVCSRGTCISGPGSCSGPVG